MGSGSVGDSFRQFQAICVDPSEVKFLAAMQIMQIQGQDLGAGINQGDLAQEDKSPWCILPSGQTKCFYLTRACIIILPPNNHCLQDAFL